MAEAELEQHDLVDRHRHALNKRRRDLQPEVRRHAGEWLVRTCCGCCTCCRAAAVGFPRLSGPRALRQRAPLTSGRRLQVSPSNSSYVDQVDPGAFRAYCDGVTDGSLSVGSECQPNVSNSCPAGRRPVNLSDGVDGKACALCRAGGRRLRSTCVALCWDLLSQTEVAADCCSLVMRAGTYSPNGSGCTACAAGKYNTTVGATAACSSTCDPGSYAAAGGHGAIMSDPAGAAAC